MWKAICVAVWLCAGCFHPTYDRPACGPNDECPSGLTCSQPQKICDREGASLIDAAAIDVSVDVPPDASACFGTGAVRICLAKVPTEPLTIDDGLTLDTGTSSLCAAVVSGGENYCVVAATTINMIETLVRATGPKPLVLLATDSITSTATAFLDVGSHRDVAESLGAGADYSTCGPGTAAVGSGGGAGGSFAGGAGNGGNGNNAAGSGGIAAAATTLPINTLRGGCAGQTGAGPSASDRGLAGHGGGAVFLIAGNTIDLAGKLNASGEGGGGGLSNTGGAGGGGAGGMIGLDAPTIRITGALVANGGGGGEGCSVGGSGGDTGDDGGLVTAANGGAGQSGTGGDGGNGAAGPAAGPGESADPGSGGGGGGGGGAGIILAPTGANLGTQVSPAPTFF
jgi:hypothetical protein